MTPTTKTKFSERFATKVEDIRKKIPDDTSGSSTTNGLATETSTNSEVITEKELITLFAKVKAEKSADNLTILQLELQMQSLLALKAIDWKLWELYKKTEKSGKNN